MIELRVLVAAERTLFRQGLVALVESHAEYAVVGEGANADETRRIAAHECPDVILLDSELIEAESPVDLVMVLRAQCPNAAIVVIGEADLAAGSETEADSALKEERTRVLQEGA